VRLSDAQWAAVGAAVVLALAGGLVILIRRSSLDTEDETPVDGDPRALALAASQTTDVYALARVVTSEASVLPRAAQVGVAWATRNLAAAEGKSVFELVVGTAGRFGPQGSGGRKVSSKQVPGKLQLEIASDVLADRVSDPTGGATQFDAPGEQDREYAAGIVTHDSAEIAASRMRAGYELVVIDGVDPQVTRFWRKIA
jgi:hypothetical protein